MSENSELNWKNTTGGKGAKTPYFQPLRNNEKALQGNVYIDKEGQFWEESIDHGGTSITLLLM